MRNELLVLALGTFLFLGCRHTGATQAAVPTADAPVEAGVAGEPEAAPPETEEMDSMARVVAGRALIRRMFCPTGDWVELGSVGTSMDEAGRFVDTYRLECDGRPDVFWTVPPVGPLPPPPEGFDLVTEAQYRAFQAAMQSPKDSMDELTQLVQARPDLGWFHLALALGLYQSGRLDEALARLQVAMSKVEAPREVWRLMEAGWTRETGAPESSLSLAEASLAEHPDSEYGPVWQCVAALSARDLGRDDAPTLMVQACKAGVKNCCEGAPEGGP